MPPDTEDFQDTEFIQQTAEGAQHLNVDLGDLLAELETLNIHQANIENATITVAGALLVAGVPLRYRSGSPIFIENFEFDRGMYTGSGSGAGKDYKRQSNYSWSKGYAYQLTAGSDASQNARVSFRSGAFPKCKVGLEFYFTWHYKSDYIIVEPDFLYADIGYEPEIKIDYNGKEISILDDVLGWIPVLDWTVITSGAEDWHFFKVTFDLTTGLWDTLYFNEHEEDISEYALKERAASDTGYYYIRWSHYGEVNNNPTVYLDAICITEEE